MRLTFELRTEPAQRLDLSPLTPAGLAGMKPRNIQAIAIGTSRQALTVGDVFKLKGTDVAKLRFVGTDARCDLIGQGLTEGEITVDGDAGAYLGVRHERRQNRRERHRSDHLPAPACAAAGSTSPATPAPRQAAWRSARPTACVAAGFSIGGKAGALLGERMRRGLIIGRGDAGDYAAARMIAGTILVKGRIGRFAGYGFAAARSSSTRSRRSCCRPSAIAACSISTGFACSTCSSANDGRFRVGYRARRLIGDMAVLGKGEMLILA